MISIVIKTVTHTLQLQTDGPAVVNINLFVRSIATISDIKMVSYKIGHVKLHDEFLHHINRSSLKNYGFISNLSC